jgi:hypothetical protein
MWPSRYDDTVSRSGALVTRLSLALVLMLVAGAGLVLGSSSPSVDSAADAAPASVGLSRAALLGKDGRTNLEEVLARADIHTPVRKTAKLDSHLDYLYRVDLLNRALGRGLDPDALPPSLDAKVEQGLLRFDDADRVQIYVEVDGDFGAAANTLTGLGIVVERQSVDAAIVQGRAPIPALQAIAALPMVTSVRPPDYAHREQGSVTSQGDAILNANTMRSLYGVNGWGVKVGVISDGMQGMAASQASGDLPANVNIETCDMVASAPPGEPANPTDDKAGAEGTAMLEIVHDLAPGAELWFGYFGFNVSTAGTGLDFMAAVQCLSEHVDVVIDDIAFFNAGPYDGTSVISQNASDSLNNTSNPIRGYYNAVGNHARAHYQELFVDSGFRIDAGSGIWDIHRFSETANTTDGGEALPCGDAYCSDTVFLAPGGTVTVVLQWDDPWGASDNDYDIFLLVNEESFFPVSTNVQEGGENPTEHFSWTNETASTQLLDVILARWDGVQRTFDMFVLCGGCFSIDGNVHNFNTERSSVPNNSDAGGGVMSLGAANASSPNNIAPYSSRGPTNDGRIKPDATAIDGVSVTGNGGFPSTFFGTSAAAPHAGAIAALVLSCAPHLKHGDSGENPAAERATLRSALLDSAVDLGSPGVDNTFGAGRLDAVGVATAAGCSPDTSGDGYTDAEKIALGKDPNHYCAIMRADVNHDALVTIVDISLVAGYFGLSIPMAPLRYDQNADNMITIVDISLIASRFGQNVSACI